MIVNVIQTAKAEHDRKAAKNRMDRRKAAGLCVRCAKPKPPDNYSYCEKCRTAASKWAHVRYAMDKEIGLCVVCETNLAREGKTTCFQCALHMSQVSKKRRDSRKDPIQVAAAQKAREDEAKALMQAYAEGLTVAQIADKFGLKTGKVYYTLKINGNEFRHAKNRKGVTA